MTQDPLAITFTVPSGVSPLAVYADESGIPAVEVDGPYLTAAGSLQSPTPAVLVDGAGVYSGQAAVAVSGIIITLPYDPVLIVTGDSQSRGAADDQSSYTYTADADIVAWNASSAFAQYVPTTFTGMNGFSNNGNIGPELGFIKRFQQQFPNNKLYIVKAPKAGSFQGVGVPLAGTTSLGAVVSGNLVTVSGGTTPGTNQTLRGSGVPKGAAIPFIQSGSTWYLTRIGSAANPAFSFGPVTVTRYDATNSWDAAIFAAEGNYGEGMLWNGIGTSITNGTRGRLAAALAAVPNPRIIAHIHNTGANDKSAAGPAGEYEAALARFVARIRTDFDYSNCALTVGRVNGANADSLTVRAAQAAVAASANFHLVDTDAYPRAADNLHWNLAGLESLGRSAFDNVEW